MHPAPPLPLMPDCGGLIRTIALALPATFFSTAPTSETVRPLVPIGNLLSALPEDVTAAVVIDVSCLETARKWLDGLAFSCMVELLPLEDSSHVAHPWIQDMLHVRTAKQEQAGAELIFATTNGVGPALAHRFGLKTDAADIGLPGGNQLVGPDFRLVGQSSLQNGSAIAASQGLERIRALDARPIRSFGYRPQELGLAATTPFGEPAMAGKKMHQCGFHVDQFVSVTGLDRDGCPLLLLADPSAADGCVTRTATDLKRKLDASALSLTRQGFSVQRNPIPISPAPDTKKCLPRLYNNVIVENFPRPGRERPFVWIPHFADSEDFDAKNVDIWQKLGFHAIGVPGWSHLASRNGALRCATKIINRSMLQCSERKIAPFLQ